MCVCVYIPYTTIPSSSVKIIITSSQDLAGVGTIFTPLKVVPIPATSAVSERYAHPLLGVKVPA